MMAAKTEKVKMRMSSEYLSNLKNGQLNGYQNFEVKVVLPLKEYSIMVLNMCHTPRRTRHKPGTICPTNVPMSYFNPKNSSYCMCTSKLNSRVW